MLKHQSFGKKIQILGVHIIGILMILAYWYLSSFWGCLPLAQNFIAGFWKIIILVKRKQTFILATEM